MRRGKFSAPPRPHSGCGLVHAGGAGPSTKNAFLNGPREKGPEVYGLGRVLLEIPRGDRESVYTAKQMARVKGENSIIYGSASTQILPLILTRVDRTRATSMTLVIMMNEGTISWKSVKQKSVSLSAAESEWYADSEARKEFVYLRVIM
jgi:hypothetical protein